MNRVLRTVHVMNRVLRTAAGKKRKETDPPEHAVRIRPLAAVLLLAGAIILQASQWLTDPILTTNEHEYEQHPR